MTKTLIVAGAALQLTSGVIAQTLWAPKGEPAAYTPPHRPLTRVTEVKARHAGHKNWRELVVDDKHLRSEYIQAQSGTGVKRALHPDTRVWWVILEGEVKFDIETVPPFTAKQGAIVQCPMQTFFSWEATGGGPALIFETNIAGARTLYEAQTAPPKLPGLDWIPVSFNNREKGSFLHGNKPVATYDEVAADIDAGRCKGTIRIVQDDRGTANFIYGYNKKLPPLDEKNKGHYHPEGAEYWLILKGPVRYPIERAGVVIGETGDVVYVPAFTWHAPRWWGDGASCRLAMNGFPYISHLFEAH